jgi:hypothetical protein
MNQPAYRLRGATVGAALVIALALAGCSKSPQRAAETYLNDLKMYNYPGCYYMLSHQDQVDRTIDQFLKEIPLAPDVTPDWFKAVVRATTYDVDGTKMEGDKAIVTVKVTRPDLPLWERTIDAQLKGDQAPDSIAEKQIENGSFPKISYDDDIVLVQSEGKWRLFVDFPAQENIRKMHHDAIEDYHKHDYDKAIAGYQAAIAQLDKEQATGNAGLKFLYQKELADVQNVQKQIPEAQAYIPKLVLSDVDMKMSVSGVPGIFGKITNGGDKAIDEVQVTITYYEGKGRRKKVVYSEVHIPVATPLEFTDFARPVRPFVPGETRSFGFKLDAPADVQQKASPDMEVTAVVFTQSAAPLPKPPQPTPTASPEASPAPAAEPPGAPPVPPPPPPPPPAKH